MFTAGLFIIAKIRKQPKGLSVDEWIKEEENPAICKDMNGP